MKHKKIMSIVMASAMLLTSVPSSISSVFAKDTDSSIQVTSETSSEDDIKVDSSSNAISVTNGDSGIVVDESKSTEDISVDETETSTKSTEAPDSVEANTETTDDVTIESSFTASVENKSKDKLSVGDTAKLHVKAENKSADTASLKLYFSDTDTQLTSDTTQWSGYLTKPALSMSIKGLNKECMLSVPVKTQEDKTIDSSLKFLKEVKNDVVLSRYAVVELPADASTEFDITIANTSESSVSVIPVMEQTATSFGDATTITWKNDDGITIIDKIASTVTKNDTSDDIQISDVQGAEKGVDDIDKSDFASKRLVVVADDDKVFTDADKIIGQYGNIYLLQYDSVKDTKDAYARLKDAVKAVEPDKDVTAASNTEATTASDANADSNDDIKTEVTDVPNAISALNDMDASKPVQKAKGVIALIDTGVSESDNVIDRVSVIDDALTGNGHGDKMLADILSQDADAKVLSIRAMDDKGFGTISSLVAAMEYAIDQKVDIINLSLYARTTLTTSVLEQEIIKAAKAGIVVVGAAGNDGADVKDYVPGSVMEAYIIGAAKADGTRQTLSNYGDTVDYNVVAESTSDATALFTGYISANGLDSVADVLNKGLIYNTNYKLTDIEIDGDRNVDLSQYDVDTSKRFIVKYMYVDNSKIVDGETIDSVFDSERYLDGVVYTVQMDYPDVYDMGDGTYKVKANTPFLNGIAKSDYLDFVFARGNDYGHVVTDGVSFDNHTGIATIDKSAFDGVSESDFTDLQLQVMVGIDDITTPVVQTLTVENADGSKYSVKTPVYGLQDNYVPLDIEGSDDNITVKDFDVYLNDNKVAESESKLKWNSDKHMLYINSVAAINTYAVKVVVKKNVDAVFKIAYIGGTNTSYENVDAIAYLAEGTDISGLYKGQETIIASKVGNTGYPETMPIDNNAIGTSSKYSAYDTTAGAATNTIGIPTTMFGIGDGAFQLYESDGKTSKGNWEGYNHGIWAYCHHVSADIMSPHKSVSDVWYCILDIFTKNDDGYTYIAMAMMSSEAITDAGSVVGKNQAAGGVIVIGVKEKQNGGLSIQKQFSDTTVTNGNSNYSLEGAEYSIYTTRSGNSLSGYKTKITTNTSGYAATADDALEAGTYYVKETKASKGCKLDETIYTYTVEGGKNAADNKKTSSEPVKTGKITITKVSTNTSITNGNNCYSFEGAEYSIYTTQNSDGSLSGYVDKITIGADGKGSKDGLPIRTYYVKETKQPTNLSYALDGTVFTATLSESNLTYTATSYETPLDDPMIFRMTKKWDGEKTETIPTLEGTQFTIEYYDGYYNDLSEFRNKTPKKTWVIEVKYRESMDEYRALLNDSYLVAGSDALYKHSDGTVTLPLGTYVSWESTAAAGYTLNGDMYCNGHRYSPSDKILQQVTSKSTGVSISGSNEFSAEDTPISSTIKLVKYKANSKTPLAGVTYELKDHNGDVVGTGVTDSNGIVTFTDLYPDVYTVTETSAPNGYSLLAEPITVVCPMRVTKEDMETLGIDESKVTWDAEANIYYVFSQTYNVANPGVPVIPQTGAMITAKRFIPIACGMAVLMGATCIIFFKRKKKRA